MNKKNDLAPAAVGNDSDTVRALNEIFRQALAARASDIHLEPKETSLRVRFRVDGVMVERGTVSGVLTASLLSRVKVLGKMDIAEKRNPQDGTFKLDLPEGQVTLRASTFPCVDGEKVVLRVLRAGEIQSLERLGMTPAQVKQVKALSARSGGLCLVTGPTGAGKTSTLYSVLRGIDVRSRNVVTLEDPIEVPLPEITQGQVNYKAGFTFATGLRSILRQDPDVILVGEMRDVETATIALQASLTGHLVLSTLHTNSSIDTITRLIDIGLAPHTVANALTGIINQRLVRTVCRCATPYVLEDDAMEELGFALPIGTKLARAAGCPQCHNTGYRGRLGIYEIVEFDDTLRRAIKQNAESAVFKHLLREMKIPTVRRAGVGLAMQGQTTLEEVLRVT
jgi:general secretion pathway protein E/type IV pilus assembly protein PilB